MKKLLILFIATLFVLSACSSHDSTTKTSNNESDKAGTSENNKFKFNDDSSLNIKNAFIIKNTHDGKKYIAFKYVATNRAIEELSSLTAFKLHTKITQDSNQEIVKHVSPTKGNLGKWNKHYMGSITKGDSAKGLIAYQINNDKKVKLTLIEKNGDKVSEKLYNPKKLDTVEFDGKHDKIKIKKTSNE
ncbi:DUF5067 domain-containing protein [Mammaliicoccus stepanovicii]|uniref:Putative lipoprotein n=1 Tax=Mammaliicoccus stepanovicii TaxID=643214 RepID=A0A239YWA0_9STAP|nr:DUF5067 domain-containing protein [Mammaliicoccus stepanovicii]PNZ75355.1 hypothetical protein CD111_07880 [Mammaliicoccus stepanovicii]GGI40583.1 DUF5067 domain-containing protein [Mammaliicoccus stepanovicii]SNV63215.1 putative lipoprotein [Mammaliicoccus stepanovicii]